MPDRVQPTSLGLPAEVKVCLFDLDGVITDTAAVHSLSLIHISEPTRPY